MISTAPTHALSISWVLFLLVAVAATRSDASGRASVAPRLYRVIIPVRDIDTAEEFYADLLQLPGERVSPGRHYFDLGGTILAVYDPAAEGDPLDGGWKHHPNQYVYIAVADLEAAFERARGAGATLLGEGIVTMPWGERLFYSRDPFGNPICLVDDRTLFTGSEE